MAEHTKCPFLVVGGGIGGLATALGLANNGKSVHVLEQAPEFTELGAGLQLAPNALAVLDQLSVLETIYEHAVFPKRLVIKDAYDGKELTTLDLGESFREKFQYPYIVMHRSDLHMVLLNACRNHKNIQLLTNKQVQAVDHINNKEIKVSCGDNTEYIAEAVIGADGLWSNTRKLVADDKPICSEYVAYRGAIPISEISEDIGMDDVIMWIAPNLHLVQYPIRRGELYNQVAVFKSFHYKENSDEWGTPEELDEHFNKCCTKVQNAIKYVHRQRRWPMYDREPIENWTSGRFTLLGDAAHPMLQYLAQGACQALEDVVCLTEKLSEHDTDIEKAFLEYQQERTTRTAQVQRNARTWGDTLHAEDKITILLRNKLFKQNANNTNAVDWLYGHFAKKSKEKVT
ncbi:salicylate hydroxylase [Evansella vedderi]|uniref:Salicylate hydroxylase n=1 Tax=Evansella vedderi TaxID=38282 RepID=A0ABT9ZPZ1_9BACI|nr:FAD-dependent monooxygenase [Evansella vedderi]MDQ0253311.1 salicylate hydroxylase [Evansella vedderi]